MLLRRRCHRGHFRWVHTIRNPRNLGCPHGVRSNFNTRAPKSPWISPDQCPYREAKLLTQIWTEFGIMGSKACLSPAVRPSSGAACKSEFCARSTAAASGDFVWPLPLYTSLDIGLVLSEFWRLYGVGISQTAIHRLALKLPCRFWYRRPLRAQGSHTCKIAHERGRNRTSNI